MKAIQVSDIKSLFAGPKIISAVSLAILRFTCCSTNIKQIIDSARFHHQLIPNEVEYEYGMLSKVVEGLEMKGHKLKRFTNRGTIINALARYGKEIQGVVDYRKNGGVAGY